MFEDYYMTADDVAKALKISKSFAYIDGIEHDKVSQKLGLK